MKTLLTSMKRRKLKWYGHITQSSRTGQDYSTGNSSRRETKRQTEETMGRQHQRVVCLFVGCLSSQQHASVSQGRICTDNFTCCHTEIEAADQTFHLTQSQYTDTGPTSPSADPITPGAWQGSHWSANFEVTGMTRPRKNPGASGIRTRDLPLSSKNGLALNGISYRKAENREEWRKLVVKSTVVPQRSARLRDR